MNEQLADMQLAVEEQELQKAAAVKQGETAADEIQRQCTSLLAVCTWPSVSALCFIWPTGHDLTLM